MGYTPTQVSANRNVTAKSVIRTKHFMMGYKDKIAGKSFPDDYDHWQMNDQWNYERGRLYASIPLFRQTVPKNGKKVSNAAEYLLYIAVADKSIF